jgi:tetratricopeptide (TPR) repeat protein
MGISSQCGKAINAKHLKIITQIVVAASLIVGEIPVYAQISTETFKSSRVLIAQSDSAINRFQTLAEADDLYKKGQKQAAENLYRKVKPDFPPAEQQRAAIYDANKLPGDAQAYLRIAKEGIQQNNVDNRVFLPLQNLTQNYPEYIEGHILLAKACEQNSKVCKANAKSGQPSSAVEVLEKATEIYPDDPELLKAKISALQKKEDYLEAAIAARQFAAIYPDYEEAPEFTKLADENMKRYHSKLGGELRTQGLIGAALSVLGGVTKKDFNTGISGFDTLLMLAQGESAFGKTMADKLVKQYQEQGKLVGDPQVLNYIKGIAGRITPLMGRKFDYEFYVIKDDSINAFALPGGKVFINTGAILGTNSEAELAGLLSHEISHSVLSHGFKSVTQGSLFSNLKKVVALPDVIGQFAQAQYSQEQERQADILGTRVLSKAGYAADGLRNLMVTLNKQSKEQTTRWNSSHPAPQERVNYLESLIQRNNYNRYAFEGVKTHLNMQKTLQGIPVAADDTPTTPANALQDSQNTQPPEKPSTQKKPGKKKPTQNKPTQTKPVVAQVKLGDIALNSSQLRDDVEVRIDGAKLETARNFTIKFTIENRSKTAFIFVPLYGEVTDAKGKKLTARFYTSDSRVAPGAKMTGEVRVYGHPWTNEASQNLTLVIKESSSGSRLFRVPF